MPTTKPRNRAEYFRAYYLARKAQRPANWSTCVGCGKAMKGTKRKQYHDAACRARTYRQRTRQIEKGK